MKVRRRHRIKILVGSLLVIIVMVATAARDSSIMAAKKETSEQQNVTPRDGAEDVTGEVTIDAGTVDEAVIPKDATGLNDPSLDINEYEFYVSSDQFVYNLKNAVLREDAPTVLGLSSSHRLQDAHVVGVNEDDGVFLVGGTISTWDDGVNTAYVSGTYYFVMDRETGEVLHTKWEGDLIPPSPNSSNSLAYQRPGQTNAKQDSPNSIVSHATDASFRYTFSRDGITEKKVVYDIFSGNQQYNGLMTGFDNKLYLGGHSYFDYSTGGTVGNVAQKANWRDAILNGWIVGVRDVASNSTATANERFMITYPTVLQADSGGKVNEPIYTGRTADGRQMIAGRQHSYFTNSVTGTSALVRYYDVFKNQPTVSVIQNFNRGAVGTKNNVVSKYYLRNDGPDTGVEFGISNKDTLIIREDLADGLLYSEYDIATNIAKPLIKFPKNSKNLIEQDRDNPGYYKIMGYTPTFTNDFQEFSQQNTGPAMYTASWNRNTNKIDSLSSIPTNGLQSITLGNMQVDSKGRLVVNSTLTEPDQSFLYVKKMIGITGITASWKQKIAAAGVGVTHQMISIYDNTTDYAPAISVGEDILLDIKSDTVRNYEYGTDNESLNKLLIEGNEPNQNVKVYDTYDLEESFDENINQEWLNNRINRNHLNNDLPIDWKALGFDKDTSGPQSIKYFISDSQNQYSSATRWINKKTPQTIIENDFAIDVQNFTIPLREVGYLEDNVAKTKAKSTAWNLGTHTIDENMTLDVPIVSGKVTVNQNQLNAIKQTTVAKPFPLEFTYQTASGSIVNKIWVFVTDKNTTVDEEKELVLYGADYSIAQHNAKDHTAPIAMDKDHGSISVYDLHDANNKGVSVTNLPPIAGVKPDGTFLTSSKLNVNGTELSDIKNATIQQGVNDTEFPLTVTFDNDISVELIVTVVAKQAKLTIKFQDEDGETVYFKADGSTPEEDIFTNEIIGEKILASSIKGRPDVSAVINKILTEGYPSLNGYVPTEEVEIAKEGTTYIFKFDGAVELMDVTENMTFETGVVWVRGQTLNYESTDDFLLKVRDTRKSTGTDKKRGMFAVTAQMKTDFTYEDPATNKKSILKDAQIVYNNGTNDVVLSMDNGAQPIFRQTVSSADKNFEIQLDEKGAVKDGGIRLEVPDSGILKETYIAQIEWDLIAGP